MTSDHMDLRSSSSSDDHLQPDTFNASVHIVNLERASLSRRLERVCCLLACDDTASVNLYLDQRQELDFIEFRLTHGIRQLYVSKKRCMIMVQLLTHQRLDITLDSAERCQTLYDMLMLIKTRPSDTDQFPRHQPKIGIARPDPTAAYLTPNDTPSNLEFNPFQASSIVPSTPSRKRVMITRSTAVSEQIHKKTRVQHSEESSTSYRQSKESYDKILSSPPGGPEVTPDRWRPPSSPTCRGDEVTTPRRAESLRQTLDQLERFGCITSPVPKPQFHSIVPTPRVLRSMNDKTRRYGREVGLRNSKRLSSLDRSSTSGCIAAVLQAMFSLDPVAKDLQDPYWLRLSGVQLGLFRSLVDAFAPYSKSQVLDIREETVSNNVVKTTKGSLGDEDDAREFLRDALNQVRQEFRERNVDTACPLSRLFECDIEHTLVCMICGNESVHTEHYQDFRLEVPLCDNNRSNQTTMSIGGLFPQMFDAQQISFECEACQSDNAMVRRSISKLPEILVVHLKRFTPRLPHGCNKNRNIVTIDETLEFSQFCSLAAFSTDISDSVQTQYSDDDRTFRRPHIPSDNFPSSESSRFSSISPMRHDNPFGSFSPPIDYLDASLHNPQGEGTAGNPFWLNSDDEDLHDVSANQSYSFYEAPSEDEQYRWALEESVRESKSLSQESTLNGDRDIFRSEDVLKEGDLDAQIFGTNNTSLKGQFTDRSHDLTVEDEGKSVLKKSRSFTKDSSNNSSQDRYQPDGEDEHPDKKEAVDDEDEDKQIKAAIRASLMPDQNYTPDDKELQEKENRELEEAIKRSLLDLEENKENISPEKRPGKKGKKEKRPGALTRSCSQSLTMTLDSFKGPPLLKRANTFDVIRKLRSGRESTVSSQLQSRTQPSQRQHKDSLPYASSSQQASSQSSQEFSSFTDNSMTETRSRRDIKGKGKGKDKAPRKTQVDTKELGLGLFQLQAAISHTSLVSSTSDGHYVCDCRGMDGIWRCYDGGNKTRIGSILDLSKHRGRTGYLFFYVRCRPEDLKA